MNNSKQEQLNSANHSRKSILSRGCDPVMAAKAAEAIPPIIGYPEFVPTTNDADFIQQLESRKWSVIFFAPGACRFNATKQAIPGGNSETRGWTLEQYRDLVYKHQGDTIQIVETQEEAQTVNLLQRALEIARETS